VSSDDPNDPTRQAALREVGFIKQQLVSLANTSVGDERLFGGGDTQAPFQANGVYGGGDAIHEVQIDENVTIPTSHTGHVFDTAFASIVNLENALTAGPATGVAAAVQPLASAGQDLLGTETETGARQRQVNDTVSQLGSRQQLLLDRMQALVDADPAESMLKVQAATQALERAYAITQKTMSLNLTDYLR
jgi:flagellar hook-associated protein 3 FlgL